MQLGIQQLGLTASFSLYLSEPQAPCKALCQSSRGLKICVKYKVVINTQSLSAQEIEAEEAQLGGQSGLCETLSKIIIIMMMMKIYIGVPS